MRYQLWDCYYPGSGFAFAEQQKGLSYEQQNQILFGQRLADPLPTVTITRLSRGKLPDLLGAAWTSYIVATVLRDLLEEFCAEAAQFIPVRIARRPRARYWIANILNSLPCFDPKRSEYTTHLHPPYPIHTLQKLVLKPIPPDAPAVFHIEELPDVLMVRDDLRERMQAASSSPGRFIRVEEYSF